ncbi:alcohol dehydrogenase [Exophiala viscosa]|uniref:Alcohol dehydrogenase n=1 Tax=Exophiala viscosa TaxID=2486360 RepID=A0AAN6IFC3_9EURO|nr:alcohol dehydrogenase [Exophiala viscosa]
MLFLARLRRTSRIPGSTIRDLLEILVIRALRPPALVAVASLCHTDSVVTEDGFPTTLPCTASHEGADVQHFPIGARVMAAIPRNACGKCRSCQGPNDVHQYCQNLQGFLGIDIDGAFAEYLLCDARTSTTIPDNVSFMDAAPLACAGVTIYRAIIVSKVQKDGWIAIVGAGGGLGHLGIKFAKALGLNGVAVEARDEGLEVCKEAGADYVLDARKGKNELVEAIRAFIPQGPGVDATVNVSNADTAAALAYALTKMHGTMVQVAQPDNVIIPFVELIFRDIHVIGSLIAGSEVSQDMLNLVALHGIQVQKNVFHGLPEVPKMI